MKIIPIFLISFSGILMISAGRQGSPLHPAVESYVRKEMKEIGVPGMAVAVIRDGKVLHSNVYGTANLEWNQPVTVHTVFHIASSTKVFTSTLVMKWLQEGKLHLDDYVSKYIDHCPALWKEVQLKHLLSHESGIMWPVDNNAKIETTAQVVDRLRDSALRFPTGTQESYVNGDFFLLQYILEKVGGKPFEQLMAEEVFGPLGMKDSGYDLEQRGMPTQTMKPLKYRSQIFTKGKDGPLLFKNIYTQTSYDAAALYLSIHDGIRWAQALDRGTFISPDILDLAKIKMPAVKDKASSFTQLGWTSDLNRGHLIIGHSGGPGLGDILRIPDQKLTVIVLSNDADMYPYFALNIAKFFVKDLEIPPAPKTFDRGLAR